MGGFGQVVAEFGWLQIIGTGLIIAFLLYVLSGKANKRTGSSNSGSSMSSSIIESPPTPPSDNSDLGGSGGM